MKIPSLSEISDLIRKKINEYRRVYKIAKKPTKDEFITIVKITGLGTIIIGMVGFVIFLIVQLLSGARLWG